MQKPIKEFTISKRDLPHWQSPNAVYFITTRCKTGKILSDSQKDIVKDSIRFLDSKKYLLYAAVIMPTHFHMIIQPIEQSEDSYYSLSDIMHSIKSFSAHKIEKTIWHHENFDRIVRNENEFSEKLNYVINNPVKANLVKSPDSYKWLYYIGGIENL
jgi:REP element-mobilizing transposase RayT